jgi:hypothetical protein
MLYANSLLVTILLGLALAASNGVGSAGACTMTSEWGYAPSVAGLDRGVRSGSRAPDQRRRRHVCRTPEAVQMEGDSHAEPGVGGALSHRKAREQAQRRVAIAH